jgi:tetratricopeptide (TPR) repeat protein
MKQFLISGLLLIAFVSNAQNEQAKKYFSIGYKLIDTRNYPSAIENFLEALKLDSTGECGTGIKGKVHGELGYAYIEIGDTTNALRYLDKSIRLDSTNPFPVQNKAVLLSMQKRMDEACKLLGGLIQYNPDFIDAYIQRGFLYEYDKKHDLAVKDFKKALELNERVNILAPNLVSDINGIIDEKKNQ